MTPQEMLLAAIRARQQKSTEFGYGIITADKYVQTMLDAAGTDVCYKAARGKNTSFADVMEKASKTLVYSNSDMEVEDKIAKDRYTDLLGEVEVPKNCLMVFKHVLTTPRKDRDGDILRTEGMNPDPKMLLLWQHIHTMPIGKMLLIAEHNTKVLSLYSCIVDMNETCHDSAVMVDNGMGRFSHGFRALEFERTKEGDGQEGGFDVLKGEIMEESLVSVPANIDSETEEVLLSLVEGGKLTSPVMKQVGLTIRERKPVEVPVNLNIKVSVDQEVKDENESGSGEGEEERGTVTTSKETNETVADEKQETAEDYEVKSIPWGELQGSWEYIEGELRSKARSFVDSKMSISEDDWVGVVGTFQDSVILCHEKYASDYQETCYEASWAMLEGKPEFVGELKEVEIQIKTEIIRKEWSDRLEKIKSLDAPEEEKEEKAEMACPECGSKVIEDGSCKDCGYKLETEKPTEETSTEEFTVKDAMMKILTEGTHEDHVKMGGLLIHFQELKDRDTRVKHYRSIVGR
jgi:DNA-directed RNA polymerase subunit RPC12/RpoP